MNTKTIVISLDALGCVLLEANTEYAPNIKKLIDKGAYIKKLETIFPSVTWAIHTSVVTGENPSKHMILGNRVMDRKTNKTVRYFDPEICLKSSLIKESTIYDELKKINKTCDAVCWPLTQGAENIRNNIPEFYEQKHFEQYSSSIFQFLKAVHYPVESYARWSAEHCMAPRQDTLTLDICKQFLGNDMPDLLLTHFLTIDSFQHDFGPCSSDTRWAVGYIDSLIGELLSYIEMIGKTDSTNIVLFSDHGQADVHSEVEIDYFFQKTGFTAWRGVSNGGAVFLYQTNKDEKPLECEQLKKTLMEQEWVSSFFAQNDFDKVHLPTISDEQGYLPDAIIELKSGYFAQNSEHVESVVSRSKTKGMHGYSNDNEHMNGFLVASGPSFLQGVQLDSAQMIDICPTLEKIFNITTTNRTGRVLESLLK